ncbi:tetratricopeptide repeat protein [Aureisphaera sp. CAU 1614]|uniref:Tetratricopeptide repeat protein n=1 Tax=Halomarinibacterium sedimenti TaxID=2857106 RepID=A0A9X1FMQ1_9FLAO|nr:tetratricopeptide repeat protein [Halomarinibacterium sedimenti]MBW2937376.1 tetratricopeptide repeat protein [Halomarinibacterium sedimenti]
MKEIKMKSIVFKIVGLILFCLGSLSAQEKSKEQIKIEKETLNYLAEGSEELSKGDFPDAEVNYRKAIAINPSEEIGKYNLGNAYYNKAKNDEAMMRFKQAASIATTKPEKHKAFHNLGNTFMNAKDYQNAVEAYKNALRNNPTDDETRYNLALAKEMLEKNPPKGGDGEDDNKDKKENEDQKEDQENKDGDNEEKEDNKDKGDQKDDKKEGDEEGENEKPQEPKKENEGDQPKDQKQQPTPGQMSPQQIKNLLDAMNNEEKKVQDKINVQKQKGAKVKSTKDW